MSEERRLTRTVYDAFVAVAESADVSIRPGDIVEYMRDQNNPLGIWQVTGEFTKLHKLGVIKFDADSATWQLDSSLTYAEAVELQNGQ